MLPQNVERMRIQIIQSQQELLLSQELLLPQPFKRLVPLLPQKDNNRRIQIQLHPFPEQELLLQLLEQPQFVAVKSLIFSASKFCYALYYVHGHVNVSGGMIFLRKSFSKNQIQSIVKKLD